MIGELHTSLGSDNSDPAFAPDEPSTEALSILTADVDEQIERVFLELPETEAVAPIRGRGQDVREKLNALSHVAAGGRVIRTHGDLHLGQTMLTERGWVVLDFEGEPARPLPERRLKRSPLRDVAGMLRSFSYATAGAKLLRDVEAPEGWEERARERFLEGYHSAVDGSLLPPGQQATEQLLAVFELEKAVYELRYELNNRPDWVAIPVAGILRLLDGDTMSEADRLIARQHANPHAYLGAHPENGSVVIRTFRPAASKVEVVTADGTHEALEQRAPGRRLRGPPEGRQAADGATSSRSTTATPGRSRSTTRTASCRRSASSTCTCSARAATRSCGSAWART